MPHFPPYPAGFRPAASGLRPSARKAVRGGSKKFSSAGYFGTFSVAFRVIMYLENVEKICYYYFVLLYFIHKCG